jgi:hypothetical protein
MLLSKRGKSDENPPWASKTEIKINDYASKIMAINSSIFIPFVSHDVFLSISTRRRAGCVVNRKLSSIGAAEATSFRRKMAFLTPPLYQFMNKGFVYNCEYNDYKL